MANYEYTRINKEEIMKKEDPSFWLTNISDRNVSLADLNVTIKAFTCVNLLDKKHYSLTLEQLQTSKEKGSLFLKRDKIKPRLAAPTVINNSMPIFREAVAPSRERSTLNVKEEHYEELQVSDTEYAQENFETAEMDTVKPIIKG
jgi:hypothetical protein